MYLTKVVPIHHKLRRQAGTRRALPCVEITPEMIEAGAQVVENQCDIGSSLVAKEIAVEVFQAMRRRRREHLA